jgi:hypothetical protein
MAVTLRELPFTHKPQAIVVSLADYRSETRADHPDRAPRSPFGGTRRVLTARQIAHRECMLAHLRRGRPVRGGLALTTSIQELA